MGFTLHLSTMDKLMNWARSQSLWYYSTGVSCCADEVLNSLGCRYDLERFGCVQEADPAKADLLIVSGMVSRKLAPHLKALYESMAAPKYVLALGTCACSGGAFGPDFSYSATAGIGGILPVDIYVAGCPPRPEAVMNGLIALQDKIKGKESSSGLGVADL